MRFLWILPLLAACSSPPPRDPAADGMRAEMARLRLELFNLKLRDARRDNRKDEEVRLLREEGLRSAQPELRAAALKEMLSSGEPARYAGAGLAVPLADLIRQETDPAILEKAIDAVALIPEPAAGAAVVEALKRVPTPEVQWSAVNAIGKLKLAFAAPLVRAYIAEGTPANLRDLAVQVLGKLKDDDSLGAILAILRKAPDDRLRESAARSIGLLGGPIAVDALRRAYYDDKSPAVRKMAWSYLLALHPEFPALARFANALLDDPWRPEWIDLASRLLAYKPEGADLQQVVSIIERAAAKGAEAKDEVALLKSIITVAPRVDLLRRTADAQRRNHDYLGALKTIADAMDRTKEGDHSWWDARYDRLLILHDAGSLAAAAADAFDLLARKPPDDVRAKLADAMTRGVLEAAAQITGEDATERQRALDSAREVGPRGMAAYAAVLLDPAQKVHRANLLKAGEAITGLPAEATDKATAESWKKWAPK